MYRTIVVIIILSLRLNLYSQEKVEIPSGVVYKYASEKINNKAKEILLNELQNQPSYKLYNNSMLIIGPNLWMKIKENKNIAKITEGNVTFSIPEYNSNGNLNRTKEETGKLIQNQTDFKLFWDVIREDFKNTTITFRKLNKEELSYYWSVINFDIEEPIYIVYNEKLKLLVNINSKDFKLIWIDLV